MTQTLIEKLEALPTYSYHKEGFEGFIFPALKGEYIKTSDLRAIIEQAKAEQTLDDGEWLMKRLEQDFGQDVEWTKAIGLILSVYQKSNYSSAPQPTPQSDVVEKLRVLLQQDESYAWAWHCNIAMVAYDAGAPHKAANEQAADFMKRTFGVDVKNMDIYQSTINAPQPTPDQSERIKALEQILHDPENQPSQYGTMPLIEYEKIVAQRDRLLQALGQTAKAVIGYSDHWHDKGDLDKANKYNLLLGEHQDLIKEIEASK